MPVLIDADHAIAHNKVIVIDDELVITGSFNFSTAAQKDNAENVLMIRDAALSARYAKNWGHPPAAWPAVRRAWGAVTQEDPSRPAGDWRLLILLCQL